MKELFGTYQNTILHSFEALDRTRESLTCWRKLPIFGRFTAERSVKDSSKTPHVVRHAYVIVVTYIVFKFPKLANTLSGKKVMAFEEKDLNFEKGRR